MKVQFLSFIIILMTIRLLTAQQQVPNGDFESWPSNNFGNPEFWDSPNAETSGFPFFLTTVAQTSDSYSGSYAAKLTSGNILGQVVPGVLSLGTLNLDITNPEESEFLGVPFTDRPSDLSGYFKYATTGTDFGAIALLLTRYNEQTNNKDTIALGGTMFAPQAIYTGFDFELFYLSYEEPDSLNIIILSSASPTLVAGSELIIDDLSFSFDGHPVVDLGDDVFICPGASHTFDLGFLAGHTYTWLDLATGEVVSNEPVFTVFDEGLFKAVVQNQNGLPGMDTVEVFVYENAPTVFDLSVEGTFCENDASFEFLLDGSEEEVSYVVWKDDIPWSEPQSGTGHELVFGPYEAPGLYYVIAEDPEGNCNMSTDTLTVQLVPVPELFSVTGGGSYDESGEGVEVGLSGSETGVNYILIRNGEDLITEKAGTGSPLSFGLQGEGIYTVEAVNSEAYCMVMMEGEAVVSISTSLANIDQDVIRVFPNPAGDHFVASGLPANRKALFQLMDVRGQEQYSAMIHVDESGNYLFTKAKTLNPGFYFLRISITDGEVFTESVLIR